MFLEQMRSCSGSQDFLEDIEEQLFMTKLAGSADWVDSTV